MKIGQAGHGVEVLFVLPALYMGLHELVLPVLTILAMCLLLLVYFYIIVFFLQCY